MQMPNSANIVPKPSIGELRCVAERIPTGKATASEISIANTASWRLTPIAPADVLDDRLVVADRAPEVAAQHAPIQVRYWTWIG